MRDTCVAPPISDPHLAWEAERLALRPHFDAIAEMQADDQPDDIDDQIDALCAVDNGLIHKIRTTPPKTIEGALSVIEAIDHYEAEMFGTEDSWRHGAIGARARSIATIRRCLAEREG